jgi:tRNA 2-thiouridine synthesizing protein E
MTVEGRSIQLDRYGHLLDPEEWDEHVASEIARALGIDRLKPSHWKVLHALREYYSEHHTNPMTRDLLRQTGLTLDRLYVLFPQGITRGAIRMAGLPRPDSCL